LATTVTTWFQTDQSRFATDILSAGDGNDVVGVFNDPAFKDIVTCGGGVDRVFADKKDVVARDCEKVADRVAEFEELSESIPQSFWEGLPPRSKQTN
jgi:hypothetical protein